MSEKKMAHVAQWKYKEVEDVAELAKKNSTIALASVQNLPAKQFQQIRLSLKDKAVIRVVKNNLIKLAFEKSGKKNITALLEHMRGPTALIFSDANPFLLYKEIKKNKSTASAKPGAVAPNDIIVEQGPTNLPAGPVLSVLKGAGLDTKIDQGKIAISKTKTLVKKGETVSPQVADALARLEIEPMEVSLNVSAAYENGMIFQDSVLNIREEDTLANIQTAYLNAFNLAYNAEILIPATTKLFIQKASLSAQSLAINAEILEKQTTNAILAKNYREMLALASKLKAEAIDEDLANRINTAPAQTQAPAQQTSETTEKQEEQPEENEEKKEEEAAAGLGALFG